ncbi:MAG: FitA-like ribbon-helix-helix domain-containing protein [Rhizobiaceae bacterium]
MGQVLIRNLDDEVIESLRYKAKANGRSLEQELREIVTKAAPFTVEERVKVALSLQKDNPWIGNLDVKSAIRTGRDDEYLNDLDDGQSS